MLVIENTDLLQGDATTAAEVDFTVHGLDNNTLKLLASGQLANAKGTLYTSNSTDVISTITLVNTGAAHNHVNLYIAVAAGTSRRLIAKDFQLESGYSLHFDGKSVVILNSTGGVVSSLPSFPLAVVSGGTGAITAQAAIDALTAVSGATNEHVLTKDTFTGNAKFKAGATAVTYASAAEINTGTEAAKAIAPDQARLAGQLVQVAHAVVTALVSGSTTMPCDDTIPQNTEGFEVITCAITPKNANNNLLIIVVADISRMEGDPAIGSVALFQDSTANALSANAVWTSSAGAIGTRPLIHKMTAGTTSSTTFKVRIGGRDAGTIYSNAIISAGTRRFGGVSAGFSLTILEYAP